MSMTIEVEPVEAVIITGSRRGQIVTLAQKDELEEVPAFVLEALKKLDQELVSVIQETRLLKTELIRAREGLPCPTG